MDIPLTIDELQNGLLEGSYSCVELVDSYLARIREFDSKINSFLTVTEDQAYARAKWVDGVVKLKGQRAFDENPLLGVVIGYKDIFLTKGIRTTAGSHVLETYIPSYSASVVTKIEDAGAICIGKLNLDAWAHGSSGENSDFGPSKNPWNTDFVPGGSSSGSAAAMASNFLTVATGTDTCGSIRLPANYCGLYGLKPTYGSVSRYGIIAMASSLDTVGHFGRNIEDIKRLFTVTKGKDGKDSTLSEGPFSDVKADGKYKIGIPREFFVEGLDEKIKGKIFEQIGLLKNAGIDFVEVSLPSTKYGISVYYVVQPAEVSSNLSRYDGVRFGNLRQSFGEEAKRRIMLGSFVLSSGYYDAYYKKAMQVRTLIRNEVLESFQKVDALIAPVAPTSAFKLGEKENNPLLMYLTDIYAATANLSGIPSLAVPSGFNEKGLPMGFQLMGPRFSEYKLFDIAEIYEKATGYKPIVAKL
jgi:aspartyl-tRNA(Asn)/glutamyl-tRNA(Gln) amidotransferase subunit A